jgi:hypothetical protein
VTRAAAALPLPDARDAGVRRFYSLGSFAMLHGTPYDQLRGWRHSTYVWVPSPDIEIGRSPGWSLPCIQTWEPDGPPFTRPRIARFADTTEMMRRHYVSRETLWGCIEDGTVPGPVVWIDDRPGWLR